MLKIFKEKKLAYVAAGVSLLLQIISFLTTYQGAEYYFKGIFVLAPLLFAVAVQVVVYFLENSIRGKKNATKILALILAISCSSYFSYIGIYNNVNSPLTYYQETYTTYKNTLQAKYDSLLTQTEKKAQQQLNKVATELTTVTVGWETKKDELQALQKELDGVSAGSAVSLSAPEERNYSSYEEYAKAYEAYVSSNATSSAKSVQKQTKSILQKYGYKDRQDVVKELATIRGKQQNMNEAIKKLSKVLQTKYKGKPAVDIETIRASLAESISEGNNSTSVTQGIYKLFSLHSQYSSSTANADILTQCISLKQTKAENLMADYSEVSSKDPSACKSSLQWEISKGITEINRIYTVLEKDTKLDMADYTLEDIYILPILRLMEKDTRNMALLCLLIALLTDGLSLVFAWMFCPEKEILELKTVEELLDREDPLFEKNIAAALQLSLRHEQGEKVEIASTMTEEGKSRLADFLGYFDTSSVALDSGYSLQAPFSELGDYQALIALLCQLDLACILSDEEYQEVFGPVEGGLVVLLKTRFLLWCNNQWESVPEGQEVLA